jgi:2-polyprenyl-6-methoxyphenol hydroxylase-like FAD-dependent oxidoreductase
MENAAPLKVLIVGADVATLTLALLLEQSNMDYLLLESSDSVPVVAGGITLHPTVLPLLEQLSLRDDLLFFSQPLEQAGIQDSDMDDICSYDWSDRQAR